MRIELQGKWLSNCGQFGFEGYTDVQNTWLGLTWFLIYECTSANFSCPKLPFHVSISSFSMKSASVFVWVRAKLPARSRPHLIPIHSFCVQEYYSSACLQGGDNVFLAFLLSTRVHEFKEGGDHRLAHANTHKLPEQITYLTGGTCAGDQLLFVTHKGTSPPTFPVPTLNTWACMCTCTRCAHSRMHCPHPRGRPLLMLPSWDAFEKAFNVCSSILLIELDDVCLCDEWWPLFAGYTATRQKLQIRTSNAMQIMHFTNFYCCWNCEFILIENKIINNHLIENSILYNLLFKLFRWKGYFPGNNAPHT